MATSGLVMGSALGPFPFGLVRDWTGSFDLAFVASGLMSFGFAVLVFFFAAAPKKSDHLSIDRDDALTAAQAQGSLVNGNSPKL